MRLSEILTIYLAIGAPFGVACFFRESAPLSRLRALICAAASALLWPLSAFKLLLPSINFPDTTTGTLPTPETEISPQLQSALREFDETLKRFEGISRESFSAALAEEIEAATRSVRSAIEQHFWLMLAFNRMASEVSPVPRAMELCRIAGRTGDDLRIAGLCIHRRNTSQLRVRCERTGKELLHALADLREIADQSCAKTLINAVAARRLSEAILKLYNCSIELLSLLDDVRSAMSVARLLDAECRLLRRLEVSSLKEARERVLGGEECLTHATNPTFPPVPQETTLRARG